MGEDVRLGLDRIEGKSLTSRQTTALRHRAPATLTLTPFSGPGLQESGLGLC
jgi:hypothetical protein